MKKQHKTFAQRADAIKKRFPRSDWDSIERKDYLNELRALKAEAEQIRPLMELADKVDAVDNPGLQMNDSPMLQMSRGELPSMDGGGYFPGQGQLRVPVTKPLSGINFMNIGAEAGPASYMEPNPKTGGFTLSTDRLVGSSGNGYSKNNATPTAATVTNSLIDPPVGMMEAAMNSAKYTAPTADIGLPSYDEITAANPITPKWNEMDLSRENPVLTAAETATANSNAAQLPEGKQFQTPGTSMLPFAISAGLGAIGDIAGMINASKGPKSVNLGRMTAQNVDYSQQRDDAKRMYAQAQNVNLRNSRNMSSPANAYANMVAGNSQLYDQVGSQLGQSYMQEQNTNAQLRQQASQQNSQLAAQEAQLNLNLDMNRNQQRGQYIDRLASNIPSAMKDWREQANQQNMMNIMGEDFGLYQQVLQNPTFMQKLQQMMGVDPRFKLATQDPRIGYNIKRT